MREKKYEVEIPQAVMASFQTDIQQYPEGFCGILVGHKVTSKRTRQGDSQDTETETTVLSVAASLVLENRNCILNDIPNGQGGGDSLLNKSLDRQKLVIFCKDKIPSSMKAVKVKILGLVSYSGMLKTCPLEDKRLFKLLANGESAEDEKILMHIHTSSRKDCEMISTISKVHLFVNKEWKHDVQNQIKVPNLGSLQQPDYWQPMDIYQGLAVQGNSGEVTSKEVDSLNQLRKMATQRIKEQAERLFDSL